MIGELTMDGNIPDTNNNQHNLTQMTDEEIIRKYRSNANSIINYGVSTQGVNRYSFIANMYHAEMLRRENGKTNRTLKSWTIAIGIMTAVMLIATIINVVIAVGTNG